MQFNVKKCAVLNITRKRNTTLCQFHLFGENLITVQQHDYLGVTISHTLNWNDHCTKVINKASRTLGLLRSTLSPCSSDIKDKSSQTLVRPQIEYASEVWNPCTTTEINRLGQVQRFVFSDYRRERHVSPLVNQLNWDSLHVRRLIQQPCMFYRIQYGLVHITPAACIQRATHISARTDHPLKYINTFMPTINAYKYAFYPQVIAVWNRLPSAAVLHITPSVSVFKSFAAPAIREMHLFMDFISFN